MDYQQDGARPGKLLKDPSIWYPVNAALDGLDPWSDNPQELLRFAVYQRRMMLEALRTESLMMASSNPEAAAKVAERYREHAVPVDPEEAELEMFRREREMKEIAKMGPISLSEIKLGKRIGGDPAEWKSSMFNG